MRCSYLVAHGSVHPIRHVWHNPYPKNMDKYQQPAHVPLTTTPGPDVTKVSNAPMGVETLEVEGETSTSAPQLSTETSTTTPQWSRTPQLSTETSTPTPQSSCTPESSTKTLTQTQATSQPAKQLFPPPKKQKPSTEIILEDFHCIADALCLD